MSGTGKARGGDTGPPPHGEASLPSGRTPPPAPAPPPVDAPPAAAPAAGRSGQFDPYVDLRDTAAVEAAVRERTERRVRQERASEVATWAGTLRDLAEREVVVVLESRTGRTLAGALVAVTDDHVTLRTGTGTLALALAAVRSVRPEPGVPSPPAMGDRGPAAARRLADVIDRVKEVRSEVSLLVRDLADPLRCTIVAVGEDVVTVHLAGPARSTVYLPLTAIEGVLAEG